MNKQDIQTVLDAMHQQHPTFGIGVVKYNKAIAILTAALAEPSEPVYWQWRRKDKPWANEYIFAMELQATTDDSEVRKLFTHPASKPAPLTFEQVEDCFPEDTIVSTSGSVLASAQWLHDFARAVEAAVWGKMNGK